MKTFIQKTHPLWELVRVCKGWVWVLLLLFLLFLYRKNRLCKSTTISLKNVNVSKFYLSKKIIIITSQ